MEIWYNPKCSKCRIAKAAVSDPWLERDDPYHPRQFSDLDPPGDLVEALVGPPDRDAAVVGPPAEAER